MISHLVLLQPRASLTQAERAGFIAAFERAVREIGEVRAIRIGRRIIHGAGYESSTPPADFVAIIDFDDIPSLQAYLRHPAHAELGRMFGAVVIGPDDRPSGAAMVYDFEMGGVEMLQRF
jgi:hypothetical protein